MTSPKNKKNPTSEFDSGASVWSDVIAWQSYECAQQKPEDFDFGVEL